MKYELSSTAINNLVVFLNRVEYKGLQEIEAINEIINALKSPASDEADNE